MSGTATKRKATLAEEVQEFLDTRAEAKRLYGKADDMLKKLAGKLRKADGEVVLNEKEKAVLINNWAGKFVVWGHGGVRHYDIDVIDA